VTHELDSTFIYIHPPLAIVGYVFIFILAIALFVIHKKKSKIPHALSALAWVFVFAGLVTGMLWAQLAWGSYWSWDPKETLTLLLFLSVSAGEVAIVEKKVSAAKWITVLSAILSIVTLSTSYISIGLHTFG
jgi:ABC-type transport system involved in cytochrome c biogenesis permease subunit